MTLSPAGTQDARQVWSAVLGHLELQVTRPSFHTWLKDTVGIRVSETDIVVGTPNTFVAEMLEQRMYSLITDSVNHVLKSQLDVRFIVTSAEELTPESPSDLPINHRNNDSQDSEKSRIPYRRISLNHKYQFDTFVSGKSNELAYAASVAVSQKPGLVYNPLTIYSDVGLGKTHLLHSIGHAASVAGRSFIYVTTEEFTNEYVRSIREGNTEAFRDRYRSVDMLLLDDVQFLIGKEQTQEGFFHTFNSLHMLNKQIVITSDRPVAKLNLLERRVRSRLSGGLVVDIQRPDLETRMAILSKKLEIANRQCDSSVTDFLAERLSSNIRELEGGLNRVFAYSEITQRPLSIELAQQALSDAYLDEKSTPISPDEIIEAVSEYFNVEFSSLTGPRGRKEVALARQIAMHLIKADTDLGPTAIGQALGGKNHSTVIKNCSKISARLVTDLSLQRDISNIRNLILS